MWALDYWIEKTKPPAPYVGEVYVNKRSKAVHAVTCGQAPAEKNRMVYPSPEAAEAAGFVKRHGCLR